MDKEEKVISRKDMTDEQYIFELETILEEMSEQAEVMFEAIDISVNGLIDITLYCEDVPDIVSKEDLAKDVVRMIEGIRCQLNGEPVADETSH